MKISYRKLKIPLISPFTTGSGTYVNKYVYVFTLDHNVITACSESVTDENPFYSAEDNDKFHDIGLSVNSKENNFDLIKKYTVGVY